MGFLIRGGGTQWVPPIGFVWMSTENVSPETMFENTKWELISQNRCIMGAGDGHEGGDTVEAGLPSIWGQLNAVLFGGVTKPDNGGFFKLTYAGSKWKTVSSSSGIDIWQSNVGIRDQGVYGKSGTVHPPAYYVYMWRRAS